MYTPLHGVGETSVAAALQDRRVQPASHVLDSQRTPDGDFPNVPGHVANPEIPKTLERRDPRGPSRGADLVLASDPDADRIGVGLPSPAIPAASGRPSTATRSASCSPRS